MSDGLTVPFALAAGLSGATDSTALIVAAGLAEVAAGAIAMGLGGYLAAQSDAEHYATERRQEATEIEEKPQVESAETVDVFESYGLTAEEIAPIVAAFQRNPTAWADFMMRFELGLEAPTPGRASQSALTIAGAYIVGGLIPLAPYLVSDTVHAALPWSIGLTLGALLVFGYVKGLFTGTTPLRSAVQTAAVGSIAAAAAFLLAKAFG